MADAVVRGRDADPQPERAYSPTTSALPAVSTEEVIAPHADWLQRLRDAYGADERTFQRDMLAVVERYAEFVHLLPATADSHFREHGGLFRMGLEVSFYALQATDGVIFCGRGTITQRSALEPRWRYATFLAGLCSELYCALTHVVVSNDRAQEWPVYVSPLSLWLQAERAKRYYVRWRPRPPEARALALIAMARVVPPRALQYLAEGNAIVVPSLAAAVSASVAGEGNRLAALVRRASALVIERYCHASGDRGSTPMPGSPLECHLVEAMRRLVAERKWVANVHASRLWYAEDGMFLLWPQAAADIVALLERDGVSDVPQARQTMAALLAGVGVIEARSDGSLLWDIYVPQAATSAPAVKLAAPSLLASAVSIAPTPLQRALCEALSEIASPMAAQAELALATADHEPERTGADVRSLETDVPQRAGVTLNAPARLNPAVRDALRQIIATIDSPSQPLAAFVLEVGVFIPLREFARHGVDPALAVRALSEAGMLASDPQHPAAKTQSRNFHDQPVLGLVVASRYVVGLDAASREQAARPSLTTEP